MTQIMLDNFPKVHCPFVREEFAIDREDWLMHGRALNLRKPAVYLVRNKINPGYEWVFDDQHTFAVEKMDGQNIKVLTKKGQLEHIQNRKNVINFLSIRRGDARQREGVFNAIDRGYVESDGVQAGELIGPKLQGNPYQLDYHLWYPFSKARIQLRYKSFDQHDRNIEGWSVWLEKYIFSLFMQRRGIREIFPEGIILYNPKRRSQGKVYMAKLRRDMFDWFYKDVEIFDYERDY